jgi:D-glycero-D-manno-heptose 1,7-bisphosphate phosphatase
MSAQITTVFLDRDGVVNRKAPEGEYVERWDQFEFLPGVLEALRELREAKSRVIVVTNQRGVALGRMTIEAVAEIHSRMSEELAAAGAACAAILVCPHDEGGCDCRKPRLGLFHQAIGLFPEIDLHRAVVIGDSVADLEAGNRLGCPTYLVATERTAREILSSAPGLRVDGVAPSLLELLRVHPELRSSNGSDASSATRA